MKRFLHHLTSRRVAVILILIMALVLGLASLVPQVDLADTARIAELKQKRPLMAFLVLHLRPEGIARSPFFLVLPGLVFFSTAYSIFLRSRTELRRRRQKKPLGLQRFKVERSLELSCSPEQALEATHAVLKKGRFKLAVTSEHTSTEPLVAFRGDLGLTGSLMFHVGLLVLLFGLPISAVYRASGEVMVAEGFPSTLSERNIVQASNKAAMSPLHGVTVSVRDFSAEFSRGYAPVDYAMVFGVLRPGEPSSSQVVRVNQPVEVEGFLFTLHRYGFAPELEVKDATGKVLTAGTAILRVMPPGTEDLLTLQGGDTLKLALYPDHALRHGRSVSRSLSPVSPVLKITHLRGGKALAQGRVSRGEVSAIGGLRIRFSSLGYWAHFLVTRDPGLWFFTLASALITLGLAIRFLLDPQVAQIQLVEAPGGVHLNLVLSARYFPALMEERAKRLGDDIVTLVNKEKTRTT
ncbi:MAG: cytochrome c biogenesis protein ResB [Deltaproteobacteria bacterium]|nr:cytochrome c biogenesis protein ResB [Deltaproteobacteria bacterium]